MREYHALFIFNKMDFILLVGVARGCFVVCVGRDAVSGVLLRGVHQERLVGLDVKSECVDGCEDIFNSRFTSCGYA